MSPEGGFAEETAILEVREKVLPTESLSGWSKKYSTSWQRKLGLLMMGVHVMAEPFQAAFCTCGSCWAGFCVVQGSGDDLGAAGICAGGVREVFDRK